MERQRRQKYLPIDMLCILTRFQRSKLVFGPKPKRQSCPNSELGAWRPVRSGAVNCGLFATFPALCFQDRSRLLFSSTRSFTRSFFAAPGVLQAESGVCLESLWHAKVLCVNIWTISLWSMSYLSFLCKLAVLVGRAFSNALEKNMVVGKWSRDLP